MVCDCGAVTETSSQGGLSLTRLRYTRRANAKSEGRRVGCKYSTEERRTQVCDEGRGQSAHHPKLQLDRFPQSEQAMFCHSDVAVDGLEDGQNRSTSQHGPCPMSNE